MFAIEGPNNNQKHTQSNHKWEALKFITVNFSIASQLAIYIGVGGGENYPKTQRAHDEKIAIIATLKS